MAETEQARAAAATETTDVSLLDEILRRDAHQADRRRLRRRQARRRRPSSRSCSRRSRKDEKVDKAVVDAMIAEIDQQAVAQVNEILHHPTFQKLESAWRGLKFLDRPHRLPREHPGRDPQRVQGRPARPTSRTRPRSRRPACTSTSTRPSTARSAASPTALMIANYDFGPGAAGHRRCCRSARRVAAMAHAPFIADAGPEFFGVESFLEPAEPQGPASRSSRARSTRKWHVVPRERGRALRRPRACRASCCACRTARRPSR